MRGGLSLSIKDHMEMTALPMRRSKPTERQVVLLTGGWSSGRESLGGYEVVRAQQWSELIKWLPRLVPSTVLILEPYLASETAPAEFWEVLSSFPSIPVIAAVKVGRASSTELRRMQLAGVCGILDLRFTHSGELLSRMADTAFARPLKTRIETALSRFIGGDARILIRAAAEVAVCGGGAEDLAKVFSVNAATVNRWCGSLRLPPPRRLQLWLRLLWTALLMEDAGRSIPAAAYAAGYATDRSFRRAVQGLLGTNPRELRKRGAFETLTGEFNVDLRRYRIERTRKAEGSARVHVPISTGDKKITSRTEDVDA